MLMILVLVLLALFQLAECQLKMLAPPSLVTAVQQSSGSDLLVGATATFGAPAYGESFVGQLYSVPSNSSYCEDDYAAAMKAKFGNSTEGDLKRIFLVKRGHCTFVKKVTIAEKLGADAVVVIDSDDSTWSRKEMMSVIMADDGYGRLIHIPSVMITNEDGKIIMDAVNQLADVIVQLQWSLPQKSVVSVDFWTEAGSSAGQKFLKDYAYHANMLRGHLRFQPHYNVFGLTPSSLNPSLCLPDDPDICSNPSDVLGSEISGSDVLAEDVRQLCLWETTAKEVDVADSKYSGEWWEYVRKFADSCPMTGTSIAQFNEMCSYRVMATIPGIKADAVRQCVATQGKELLRREKANKAWSNLALRINGAKFSGTLDPIQVSKAICTAFETPPAECKTLTGLPDVVSHSGVSLSSVLMVLTIVAATGAVSLYFYQRYMRKSMRAALRHEVMLEVRSQLQEYHQLDEDTDPMTRQKRPLMISHN